MAAIQAPPQLTIPTIKPWQPQAPFVYQPSSPGTFTGAAPTAMPMGQAPTPTTVGAFAAPDPSKVADSPYFQFRFGQGQKAIERGAAARGTLLTGGLQTRLAEFGQGLASEEADKDYRRALDTYTTNRGTDALNFGQGLSTYTANRDTAAQNFAQDRSTFADTLAGFRTNADVTQTGNTQGLQAAEAGYDRNQAAGRTAYEDSAADAMRRTGVANTNAMSAYQAQIQDYARQQEEARQAQDQQVQQQEMERQRLANEALQREGSARQNQATNALGPVLSPYLPPEYFQERPRGRVARA